MTCWLESLLTILTCSPLSGFFHSFIHCKAKMSSEQENEQSEERVSQHAARQAALAAPSRLRRRGQTSLPQSRSSQAVPSQLSTYTYEALPDYLKDNEFIQTGYRYNLPVKDTLKSLFGLHNETGNVWSHLIGFMFFVVLTVWVSVSPPTPMMFARPQLECLWHAVRGHTHAIGGSVGENLHHLHENLPSLPNLQTLQDTVHSLQTSYHQLQDSLQSGLSSRVHSLQDSVHSLQGRVQLSAHALADQLQHGLAALIPESIGTGTGFEQLLSGLAHGLQWPTPRWPMYVFLAGAMTCLLLSAFCHLFGCCKEHVALFIWRLDYTGIALLIVSSFYPAVYYSFMCHPYLTYVYLSIITVLGTAAVCMSLLEVFQRSEWRPTRAGLYVGLGLMGVIPVVHVMVLHSDVWHVRNAVYRDILMGASYLVGAAVYALRVPERWFPGKFDFWLHSHQIFHLFVVLGAYMHFQAAMLLLEWRDASGGCALPVTRPLNRLLEELASHGHELLHVDQVWQWLRVMAEQLHVYAASGMPNAPLAALPTPAAVA